MQGMSSVYAGDDICAHLAAAPDGTCLSMSGRTFHIPEGNNGIPYAWASFPMFPAHGMVEKTNVNTGLFSLKPAAVGASMRGMSGRNKGLSDARVKLGPQQCIVLDSSCENFQFRNVTFTGMPLPAVITCHVL